MESKGQPPARVYQDFEPSMEWVPEDDSDTLLVYLPGFAKEQLRVQLRSRNLIISGERKLQQNTWSRFRVEFPVSGNCDLNKISAKFEGNILFVRQPKLITQASKPKEEKPAAAVATPAPMPQKPEVESNATQKATEAKPAPTTESKIEKKVEEKGVGNDSKTPQGVRENESDKKRTSRSDKKNKKVLDGELDKTAKTVLDKYKQAATAFAMTLKTSSSVVNTIVVVVVGIVIGIYVSNSIKSWTKA